MISTKEIEIRYSETDQMGVVYHANYLIWFDMARTKFLADLGFNYAELEKRNILFPVRKIDIEYLSPCRFGEKIYVETTVKEFNSIKTIYKHVIKNTNNEIKAIGESFVVCVNRDNFKLTKIEKYAKDVYDAYIKITNSNF